MSFSHLLSIFLPASLPYFLPPSLFFLFSLPLPSFLLSPFSSSSFLLLFLPCFPHYFPFCSACLRFSSSSSSFISCLLSFFPASLSPSVLPSFFIFFASLLSFPSCSYNYLLFIKVVDKLFTSPSLRRHLKFFTAVQVLDDGLDQSGSE